LHLWITHWQICFLEDNIEQHNFIINDDKLHALLNITQKTNRTYINIAK
jgi:hypothetical protein